MEAWQLAIPGCAGASRIRPIEGIIDITSDPPAIRNRRCPVPGVVRSPITDAVEDGSSSGIQSITHGLVAIVGDHAVALLALVVAVVVLEVIDAPACKGHGILLLHTQTAFILSTGQFASTAVHAKAKGHVVEGVSDVGHAVRKFGHVGLEGAIVAAAGRPAVVKDDVVIADIAESAIH